MHSSPRRLLRSGSSLIEVLIASAVLAIAIAALGTQATVGMRAAQRAEGDAIALLICQSLLDEFSDRPSSFEVDAARPVPGFPKWTFVTRTSPFQPESSSLPYETLGRLQTLSITVWRNDGSSKKDRVSLERVVQVHSVAVGSDVSMGAP